MLRLLHHTRRLLARTLFAAPVSARLVWVPAQLSHTLSLATSQDGRTKRCSVYTMGRQQEVWLSSQSGRRGEWRHGERSRQRSGDDPLSRTVEACIQQRQCTLQDMETIMKYLSSNTAIAAPVSLTTVLKAGQSMRFLRPGDARLALPCIDAITTALEHSLQRGGSLSAGQLCHLIANLKHFDSSSAPVRRYVAFVSASLLRLPPPLGVRMQELSAAMFGIRKMCSDAAEVRGLLSVLSVLAGSCTERLSAQHVGNALYGLQDMAGDEMGMKIISSTWHAMNSSFATDDINDLRDLLRVLCICQKSVRQAIGGSVASANDEVAVAIEQLRMRISAIHSSKRGGLGGDSIAGMNRGEAKTRAALEDRFGHFNNVRVTSNEYIDGFEMDVVMRVYPEVWEQQQHNHHGNISSSSMIPPRLVINVEVDGPTHAFPTKRRFCALRDKYLREAHGVSVIRLDYSNSHRSKTQKLK